MRQYIFLLISSFLMIGCNENNQPLGIDNVDNHHSSQVDSLQNFINADKFLADEQTFYVGLSRKELVPVMNSLMNEAAKDFIEVTKQSPSDKDYQERIRTGLERFSPYYLQLDTEDRERVCMYFEQMMDIVKLESSGGLLNEWLYGFNPNKKAASKDSL